jgi:hypothetical protein
MSGAVYNQQAYFAPFSQQNNHLAYQPAYNQPSYGQQPQPYGNNSYSHSYSTSSHHKGPSYSTHSSYSAPPQYSTNSYGGQQPHGYGQTYPVNHAPTNPAHYAGQVMNQYMQPVKNFYNKNIHQPIQQFAQRHPVAAGAASALGAGMGMGAMTGCPYAGATAAMGAAAPYMDQIGQAAQQGYQNVTNNMQNMWNNITTNFGGGQHAYGH